MKVNLEPIGRDALLTEHREVLGASIREETQLDGTIVMIGGDPGEVIVRVDGSNVSIALFRVSWNGPYTPVVRPIKVCNLELATASGFHAHDDTSRPNHRRA
jgi:hypothetical protein